MSNKKNVAFQWDVRCDSVPIKKYPVVLATCKNKHGIRKNVYWHDPEVYEYHCGFLKTWIPLSSILLKSPSRSKYSAFKHTIPPCRLPNHLEVVKQQGFAIIVQNHGCSLTLGLRRVVMIKNCIGIGIN